MKNLFSVSGKVALVTGGSRGIGLMIARGLVENGVKTYISSRSDNACNAVAEELSSLGECIAIPADLSESNQVKRLADEIISREPKLHILVNNAGYGSYGSLEDVAMQEARHQFEVNIFGLARLTQLVLKSMRERGQGKIINVSSIGGKLGEPHGCWYHASKYAVEGLSDSLRMELKQFKLRKEH